MERLKETRGIAASRLIAGPHPMCNLFVHQPPIYHGFRVSESGIDMLVTRSTLRCSAAAGHALHLNRHLEVSFSLLAISLHMSA
jgi:hypothetical protein